MTRLLVSACLLFTLQGCSYNPVYRDGTFAEKAGSAFMRFMLPSRHQLERAERGSAGDQGF